MRVSHARAASLQNGNMPIGVLGHSFGKLVCAKPGTRSVPTNSFKQWQMTFVLSIVSVLCSMPCS